MTQFVLFLAMLVSSIYALEDFREDLEREQKYSHDLKVLTNLTLSGFLPILPHNLDFLKALASSPKKFNRLLNLIKSNISHPVLKWKALPVNVKKILFNKGIEISDNGNFILFASEGGGETILQVLNLSTKEIKEVVFEDMFENFDIVTMKISNCGNMILVRDCDGDLGIYKIDTQALIFLENFDSTEYATFSKDGKCVLSMGCIGIYLWDTSDGSLIFSEDGLDFDVCALSNDCNIIATAEQEAIKIYRIDETEVSAIDLPEDGLIILNMKFSKDNKFLHIESLDNAGDADRNLVLSLQKKEWLLDTEGVYSINENNYIYIQYPDCIKVYDYLANRYYTFDIINPSVKQCMSESVFVSFFKERNKRYLSVNNLKYPLKPLNIKLNNVENVFDMAIISKDLLAVLSYEEDLSDCGFDPKSVEKYLSVFDLYTGKLLKKVNLGCKFYTIVTPISSDSKNNVVLKAKDHITVISV